MKIDITADLITVAECPPVLERTVLSVYSACLL